VRDVEKLRERLTLSLDNGQVAALLVAALLLLGGSFAVGLMVGRRTAAAPRAEAGDLAALDADARRPETAAAAPAPRAAPPAPQPETRVAPEQAAASVKPPAHAAAFVPAAVRAATVVPPPPRAVEVASSATVPLPPPPRDPGAYTVQVGASQDRGEAARLLGRARAAGLKPYVMEADLGAKGTWFRVRVGAFGDKDSANRFQKDVERELRVAAVVMPTR
jgi:DedD protein